MAETGQADLSAFARSLGLPEGVDEATIAAAIRGRGPWPAIAEALGLPAGSTMAACVAAAGALKAAAEAEEARLRNRLRAARARLVMLEAIREAGDALDP